MNVGDYHRQLSLIIIVCRIAFGTIPDVRGKNDKKKTTTATT